MNNDQCDSERIVLSIPVGFTLGQLAQLCRVHPDSPAMSSLEDLLPDVNQYAEPKAILRWCSVDSIENDRTTIAGVTFESKVMADKLKNMTRVVLSVVTAGNGLERSEDLADHPFLDLINAAILSEAGKYVVRYLKENFDYDGSSALNPGSLPDWPIINNFALANLIGNVSEIGIELADTGYMKPWNSRSSIHFPGNGYENCSLCKNYDCAVRRAKFDREEYIRIFGAEP